MKLRSWWWWTIGGGLLVATGAWAIYVVNWYLFLARRFPTAVPERRDLTALLADLQGYAMAFGPLLVVVIGLVGLRAFRRYHLRSTRDRTSA